MIKLLLIPVFVGLVLKAAFPPTKQRPEPIRKRVSKDKRKRVKYTVYDDSRNKNIVTSRQNFYKEKDSLVWSFEIESDSRRNNPYIRGQRMVNDWSISGQQNNVSIDNQKTTYTGQSL